MNFFNQAFFWLGRGVLLALFMIFSFLDAPSYSSENLHRLQGVLEQLLQTSNSHPQQLGALSRDRGIAVSAGRVRVVVELEAVGNVSAIRAELERVGATDVSDYKNLLEAQVPIQALSLLAKTDGVHYVRLPYVPKPASVFSEGISLIGANEYQRVGLTGQGIKIAVIDLGFEGLASAFVSGDLPANIVQVDLSNSGMGGIAHGTAVAEIVHDVAPGAQLYLMKITNEVQLGQAVEEAIRQGVKIINHSVVWYNTEFGDGTGGVSQIAAQAVSRGVVWVNAAGNTALLHWKGSFRDQDDDSWAEFDFLGGETLSLQAEAGEIVEVFLNWDAWPQTAVDYDLFLTFDANGNGIADLGEIFVSSTDPQRGLDPPIEQARFFTASRGRYLISVQYKGAQQPPPFELFTAQHTLQSPIRESSVLAPATAVNVLAVGAIDQASWGSAQLQAFSAQGPTSDGRIKPDLVAPDAVRNFTASEFPAEFGVEGRFIGTSASAPHVAGAVALLMEETPGMTGNQAFLKLTRNALNLPPFSPNNVSGFGKVHLSLTPTDEFDLILSDLNVSDPDRAIEAGETITVSVKVHNPHPRVVSMTLPLIVDGQTVAVQEIALHPSQTRTVTFSWQFLTEGAFLVSAGDLEPITVQVVEALEIFRVQLFPQSNYVLQLNVEGNGISSVILDVFDLSGQQVIHLESASLPLTVPFFNEFGAPLANGIYLYKVSIVGATNVKQLPLKKLLILF